jgi:hypothetical protein
MSARRHRPGLLPVVVLGLSMLLGACTATEDTATDEPEPDVAVTEPPPQVGVEAAVVLPPRVLAAEQVLDAIAVDLQVLEAANEPELRAVWALHPDDAVFVRDLALYAGQRSADLTCVLGPDGPSLVAELAALRPAARFCAVVGLAPAEAPPRGIDLLVVRAEELGHIVGMATAALPGDRIAIAVGTTKLEGSRFIDGFVAGVGQLEVLLLDDDAVEPTEIVARAVAGGADSILLGSGDEAPAMVDAARTAGLSIIGPQALAEAEDDRGFGITWRIRWDRVLQPSVDRVVGRSEPAGRSLGFSENIFDVRVPAGSAAVEGVIEQGVTEIEDEDRDPLQPPAVPEPPE